MRKKRRRIAAAIAVTGMAGMLVVLPAGIAQAHAQVRFGSFHGEVGFGVEPSYVGFPNSVQLILSDASGSPVVDLGDTLKVEVAFGSQTTPLALVPNFDPGGDGIQGDYRAYFIPTAPGAYTFHFTGSIKGTTVDRSITSGPTTFDEVQDPVGIQFPAKVPTTAELAARITREVPRLNAAIAAAADRARSEANTARLAGFIGIALGALGLAIGGMAITRRRGAPAP